MSIAADIFRGATRAWASKSRLYVVNVIRDHYLAGQVLKRRTGTGVRSITSESSSNDDSFTVGTNVVYMVGWEMGFTRPAYVVYPKTAQALKIPVEGGFIFRKWARIPSKTFAARPFIQPGLKESEPYIIETAQNEFSRISSTLFPDRVIRVGGVS